MSMVYTVADAFSVDTDDLADALQRMQEFVQHTESVVAEVNSLVTQLHQTWSGDAAAAHAEAHRRWSHGETLMREAMAHLKTIGAVAHHNYTGAVAANMSLWS
jgi:WXG100 family type VII secretion target